MSDDDKPEFLSNPNPIAKKARVMVGRTADDMLKTAEARLDTLKGDFTTIIKKDVDRLAELIKQAEVDLPNRDAHIQMLKKVFHELRGQGGTFGYPLISEVGDSACKYIDASPTMGDAQVKILKAHVDTFKAVVAGNIQGDGGAIGRELMKTLQFILARAKG
ncbi:MAG: hypothetical protein FJX46_11615 [Alphaproteobacteria bacterium]|nr:hypothetical protein [Alphaproteobacteria bacterium]